VREGYDRAQGVTIWGIARELGISPTTVQRRFRELEINSPVPQTGGETLRRKRVNVGDLVAAGLYCLP
jgi:AraC-like DNA-binding protein